VFTTKEYPSISTRIQGKNELPLMIDVNCRRKNDNFHYHNYIQICYVLAGKMEFSIENEVQLVEAGNAVFILPYHDHHLNTCVSEDTPITVMISFQDTFITQRGFSFFTHSKKYANFEGMKFPVFTDFSDDEKQQSNQLMREIIAEFSKHFDMSYDHLAELLVQFLKIACTKKIDIDNQKSYKYIQERSYAISESIRYMAANFHKKITIDDLCSVAAMSRSVYMDNFKSILGESPIKFLTKVRVQQAKAMLVASDMPMGELAKKVGFYDKSRLIHAFKELFGISPLAMKNAFPQSMYDTYENSKRRWAWFSENDND